MTCSGYYSWRERWAPWLACGVVAALTLGVGLFLLSLAGLSPTFV